MDRAILLEVVRNTPLVSIDLIIRNQDHDVLLGLRVNQPAKDTWFVPGGCIAKGEHIEEAFERVARMELGASLSLRQTRFLGVFEHFYDENFAEVPGFGTHHVVLAYEAAVPDLARENLGQQHSDYRWWSQAEILRSSAVHPYTKAYFK